MMNVELPLTSRIRIIVESKLKATKQILEELEKIEEDLNKVENRLREIHPNNPQILTSISNIQGRLRQAENELRRRFEERVLNELVNIKKSYDFIKERLSNRIVIYSQFEKDEEQQLIEKLSHYIAFVIHVLDFIEKVDRELKGAGKVNFKELDKAIEEYERRGFEKIIEEKQREIAQIFQKIIKDLKMEEAEYKDLKHIADLI